MEVKRLKESGVKEISLAKFTLSLQSQIIINISVGTAYSATMVEQEDKAGKLKMIGLATALDELIQESVDRIFRLHHIMAPRLIKFNYMPSDWLYARNVLKFRSVL